MGINIRIIILLLLFFCVSKVYTQDNTSIVNILNCGIEDMREGNIKAAIDNFHRIEKVKELSENNEIQQTVFFLLMSCYLADGQSDVVISYGKKILEMNNIQEEMYNEVNNMLLLSYTDLRDINKGKEIALKVENIINKALPSDVKFSYLVNLITFYWESNDTEKIRELSKQAEKLIAEIQNLSTVDEKTFKINLNTLYVSLMSYYENICDYDKQIQYGEKAIGYIIPETEKTELLLFVSLSNAYFKIGNIKESKKNANKAIDIIENNKFINNSDNIRNIGIAYQTFADLLLEDNQNIEAINWFHKAIEKYHECNEDGYIKYCYSKLYNVYNTIGYVSEANKMEKLILDNIKNIKGKNDVETAVVLSVYGDILLKRNNVKKSLEVYNRSTNLEIKLFGERYRGLIRNYLRVANAYSLKRDYRQARIYVNKAIEVASNNKNCNDGYMMSIMQLSDIAIKEGNLGEAISLLESIKSQVEKLDNKSPIKNSYYPQINHLYSYIGGDELKIENIYRDYIKTHEGERSRGYALSLINNSSNLLAAGKYIEAVKECQKGLEILKDNKLSRTKDYHDALRKQALNIIQIDSVQARNIIDSCVVLASELFGENSIEYGRDLISSVMLSPYYLQNELSAIETFQKGVDIIRRAGADNTLEHFYNLNVLSAWYAYVFNDYETSYMIDKENFIKIKTYIVDNFCNLRNNQRVGLWNNLKSIVSSLIVKASSTWNDEFLKLVYNEALLRKNLLLNSSTSLRSVILKSGNEDAIAELNTYLSLLSKDNKEDTSILDTNELGRIERELINIAESYGAITDFINIDWTDIRNSLLPHEAAIEIVESCTNDSILNYYALVLKYNSYSPQLIPLFNSAELDLFEDKETGINYNNPNVYKLIWRNLEKYALDNIETIYFSADGLIHKIAIENLVDTGGICAYEKWHIKRLSSTRELINRNVKNRTNKYILYGDLDYEASMESKNNNLHGMRCIDYSSFRAGFGELPGTMIEINGIAKVLEENNINCKLMDGVEGTEESFKSLSGSDFNVIHLATHGFFWTDDEVKMKNFKISNIISNNRNPIDNALYRSGIVFSGSNNILKGINIPKDRDDGILTAEEISTMNLNSVDMVVLSACETGLGDINSEGVFGLQRGFKLAGVNTLLMSLWKVADDSTQIFMNEFYKAFLQGKSKQQALDYAKKYLRENSYSDPLEWAGWILLDALN